MNIEKLVMRTAIAVFLLCVAGIALAATGNAQITFVRPTLYTDGTPLPVTAISGFQINCTFQNTGSSVVNPCTAQSPLELPGNVTTGAVTFTFPAQGGRACFTMRTRVGSAVSDPSSPEACRDFAPLAPNPPTGVTVTVTVTVATP